MAKPKTADESTNEANKLARLGLFFYDHIKVSLAVVAALLLAGVLSFNVWLNREGFPPIEFPLGIASGTYFVDDSEKVDSDITKPISDYLLDEVEAITEVQTSAGTNFFSIAAFFESGTSNAQASQSFRAAVEGSGIIPAAANISFTELNPSKYLGEYDILVSVYAHNRGSLADIEAAAASAGNQLQANPSVSRADVLSSFETATSPFTGEAETRQTMFGRVGLEQNGETNFYPSVTVGVVGEGSIDVIELSGEVNQAIDAINASADFAGYSATSSADVAPAISTQINSLQDNVITGLIAVSIISFLLITWRASIITALFILSVMLVSFFVMFLIGYSINTISLFALVLALGLFVDDATIVVEAIDAGKGGNKPPREVVAHAVKRVAAASIAGTLTTVLVFLPLVFVTGILGEFIRILPITIIIALLTSLVMSLTAIPFMSRFILFSKKPTKPSPINRAEQWLADKIAGLPLIFRTSRNKGWAVSLLMVSISLGFILATGIFAQKVEFNIFPQSKDSDQLQIDIVYPPGTSIGRAEAIADEVNLLVGGVLGEDFDSLAYYDSSERAATAFVQLVPFDSRETTSLQYLDRLAEVTADYDKADVRAIQLDPGPPSEEFPFKVQVLAENPADSLVIAGAIENLLSGAEVARPNGTTALITGTNIAGRDVVSRSDGQRFIEVQAGFDSDDTTALVVAAQEYVEAEISQASLDEAGVELGFDFGQESENQDSFASLVIVGPIALLAMFILLAVQFRSLIQPLLIFLAIPFSFFGVFYGLYMTDNPISFFSMIGFFGLIGIAVNNTILLTDYANQERRGGLPIVEAISQATKKRFRPLLATSLTTVAALTPLALSDPFWVPLAVTIIFGLLSSTLLVIISFPYYYLFIEGARTRVKARWARRRS